MHRVGILIEDNYIIQRSILYFIYEDITKILYFSPSEGHIDGGNKVEVHGNFTLFWNKVFKMFFGAIEITSFVSIKEGVITVLAP